MTMKGSSRKGARRRQAVVAAGPREDCEIELPTPDVEAVKLDLNEHGIIKEIARIETIIQKEAPPLPRHAQNDEVTWGQKPPRREQRLTWISFATAIVLLFVSIALLNMFSSDDNGPSRIAIEVITDDWATASPHVAFQKNPYDVQVECSEIFRKFTAARKYSEARPLIRIQPNTEKRLNSQWQPWPSPPVLDPEMLESGFDETHGRGYFWLRGSNQDGSVFLAFFVAEGSTILLDWEATLQHGETRLATLSRIPTVNPVLVRVILTPDTYYLPTLPESDYESFKISNLQNDTTVWGYIKRDTPEHESMKALLHQDSLLIGEKQQIRATIYLKKAGDVSMHNLFFITEMLHKDWVMP